MSEFTGAGDTSVRASLTAAPRLLMSSRGAFGARGTMNLPPLVGIRHGKRVVSLWGICATGLVVEVLCIGGFLAARFALDFLFGGTVDLLPGVLFAATMPVGGALGGQLRRALAVPAEQLPEV